MNTTWKDHRLEAPGPEQCICERSCGQSQARGGDPVPPRLRVKDSWGRRRESKPPSANYNLAALPLSYTGPRTTIRWPCELQTKSLTRLGISRTPAASATASCSPVSRRSRGHTLRQSRRKSGPPAGQFRRDTLGAPKPKYRSSVRANRRVARSRPTHAQISNRIARRRQSPVVANRRHKIVVGGRNAWKEISSCLRLSTYS